MTRWGYFAGLVRLPIATVKNATRAHKSRKGATRNNSARRAFIVPAYSLFRCRTKKGTTPLGLDKQPSMFAAFHVCEKIRNCK
jgi:hypothetical protein